jgi:hypothetical protein
MRPFQLGAPPPTRVVIFGPRSGTIFGRVTISGPIRVAVLDSNSY